MPDDRGKSESPYTKSYLISVVVHAVILLSLAVASVFNGCQCLRRQKKLPPAPIEFTVAIPEDYVPSQPDEPKVEEKSPLDDPEAIREPEPENPKEVEKPKEKPKPKPKFQKSTTIVERKPKERPREIIKNLPKDVKTVKATRPKLTPAEIEKLLALGAKPSDLTSVPGEDEISLLAIKNALYKAWIVPSAEHLTGHPAEIEISLGTSGAILGYRVVKSSGSRVLDNSALDAAAAVRQIPGLSPGFLRSHRKVTIAFDLE